MGLFDFSTTETPGSSGSSGGLFNFSSKPTAPAAPAKTPVYAGPYTAAHYSPAVNQAVEKITPTVTKAVSGNPHIPGLGSVFTPAEAKEFGTAPKSSSTPSLGTDIKNIWNTITAQFKEATAPKPSGKNPDVVKPIVPPTHSPKDPNDLELTIRLGNINAHSSQLATTQKDLTAESNIIGDLGRQIDAMKDKVDPTSQASIDRFNSLVNKYNAKVKVFTPKVTDFQTSISDLKSNTDSYNADLDKNISKKQYAAQLFGDAGKDPHGLWGAVWKDLTIPVKVLPAMISGIWNSETAPGTDVQNIESNMIGGSQLFGDAGKSGLGTAVAQDLQIPAKVMTRFFAPIIQGAGQNIADAILANSSGARARYGITEEDIPNLPSAKETILQGVGNFMQLAFAVATPGIAEKLGLAGASEATMEGILSEVANKSLSQSFAPLARIIGQSAIDAAINGGEAGLLFGVGQALSSGSKDPMEITSTIFSSAVGMAMLGAAIGSGSTLTESAKIALFKNVSDFYGIPKDFTIKMDAINHLIDTKQLSEEDGKSILKGFGFSDEQIAKMRSGEAHYTITRPTQDIFEITDKPYWAKLKSIIGLDSTTQQIPHNIKGTEITGQPTGIVPYGSEAAETTPIVPRGDIEKAAEEIKSPVVQEQNPFKNDIKDIASGFTPKTPSIEGLDLKQPTKLSNEAAHPLAESAADQYWNKFLKPEIGKGKGIVVAADDLKDYFGQDYNDNNHPVYSKAASDILFKKALAENKNPEVVFNAGGPGSGKTEFITKTLLESGFKGTIYDSNLSSYQGAKDQIALAREAGKNIQIRGIITNLETARGFTLDRGAATGRQIQDKTFAHGHTEWINTVKRLLEEGIVKAEEVHILDTREITSAQDIVREVLANSGARDPLAILRDTSYNKDNVQKTFTKENYSERDGRHVFNAGSGDESLSAPGEDRADQGRENNVEGGSSEILQERIKEGIEPAETQEEILIQSDPGSVKYIFGDAGDPKNPYNKGKNIINEKKVLVHNPDTKVGNARNSPEGRNAGAPGRANEYTEDQQYIDIRGKEAKTPSDVAELLKDYRNPIREMFHIVYTDEAGKVLAHSSLTSNQPDLVNLGKTEVLYRINQRAERLKAANVFIAHNHPSGNAQPSEGDRMITERIAKATLNFHSHVVLDHDHFFTINKDGTYKKTKLDLGKSYQSTGDEIAGPIDAINVFRSHYDFEKGKVGILIVNRQLMPIALEKISFDPKSIAKSTLQIVREKGGIGAFLAGDKSILPALEKEDVKIPFLLDSVTKEGEEFSALTFPQINKLSAGTDQFVNEDKTIRVFEGGKIYEGEKDLTLATLEKLKGRDTVSKQFISDLTNSGDIKQVERDIIREVLAGYPDGAKIPVVQFAKDVKLELLPLERMTSEDRKGNSNSFPSSQYENVSLPDEIRGNVADYSENIYESPIKTSAGSTHFGNQSDHYFGHTRVEDMKTPHKKLKSGEIIYDKDTVRRVIEVQSDLYQKGNLERESGDKMINADFEDFLTPGEMKQLRALTAQKHHLKMGTSNEATYKQIDKIDKELKPLQDKINKVVEEKNKTFTKLQQYNDPTAHFRMVREEIKQAAIDGKTKLQFPTGETAMKIEGLGESPMIWVDIAERDTKPFQDLPELTPETLKVGMSIEPSNQPGQWVITDVLGDGQFTAIPKNKLPKLEYMPSNNKTRIEYPSGTVETMDGHVKMPEIIELNQAEPNSHIFNNEETFDISGKLDTNNPIYRFYEKDLGRYLKNKYDAKPVTDDKGVTWNEVEIKPEMKDQPVHVFEEGKKYRGAEEKNPVFDSGDKLKDVQDALAYAEERIGVKTAAIGKVKNMINREELSLEAAAENPELFKKVYGDNRIEEHKAKLSDLRKRLLDLNKSITEIKSDYKPEDLEKAVAELTPDYLAPKIRVLNKEVRIPEALTNRQIGLEIKKEALENSPYNQLQRYIAKSGAFKGELPEVTGNKPSKESFYYGKIRSTDVLDFIQKGDQIIQSAFFDYGEVPDTEEVREGMQTFLKQKEALKEERKSLLADIKSFIKIEKDKIAIEKMAQRQNEQIDKEQEKAQKILDNKREAETLQDWKNFIASYTAEQSLPQTLEEVIPPVSRGNIRSPKLNLADAQDKGWMARESLDRNIEKTFTRADAKRLNEFLGDHLRENMAKEVEYKDAKLKILEGKMKDLGIKPGSDESAFVQIYGEGMTTIDQLMKEFPKTWQNIQAAVPIFKEMYETILADWNPIRNQYGYPDIPPIKNYFPHFDSISFWTKHYGILNKNDDLPTSIAGLTKNFQPGKTFSRHELHRTGHKTKYDAIAGAKEYINSVAKQMFTMDSIARANAILKYIRSSDEVAQRLGTPLKLSRFTTNLQNIKQNQLASKVGGLDREIEDNGDRKVINFILTISKLIGKNIIAFNPAAVLSHGVSISLNAARVDKIPFIKGMMTTVSSPFLKDPYYMIDGQRSDLLFYRYPKEYLKTKFETLDEAGGWMIKQMDIFKVRTAVASKFYELTNDGMDPKIAIKEADKFAGRIVGDYSRGQKPNLMNQKVLKMIAQFQFGMNDAMSVILHDFAYDNKKLDADGNVKTDEKTGKEKQDHLKMWWQIAQWMIYAYLMNEFLYKPIKGSGKGLSPINLALTLAGHDDATRGLPFSTRVGATGTELAGELPFVNVFFGNSPTAGAFSQLIKDAVAGNLWGVGGDLAATFLSPIGGGNQVKKTLAGIKAYSQGYVTSKSGIPQFGVEKSAWSLFQNIVFGPSATSAAQAYYNSIGKPSEAKATFEKIQQLIADGKVDEAKAITAAMTPKEYGTYKAERTRMLETKAIPETQKILDLLKAGKIDEAAKITGAMTPEEYKIYKGSKAMILKAESGLANNNNNDIATFEGHATYYGGSKGPDAAEILNTHPDDGKIASYNPNGEPIYARDAGLEARRRAELIAQDPYWSVTASQYDHIVPIGAGGTNTANNVQLISKKADDGNQPFENFIVGLYRTGGISRANVIKASIDYKIKKTVSLDDIINGKY